MERVLVTGVTGLLGNNVVRQLLAAGRSVRVLARSGSDPRPLEGLSVEHATGDVCNPLDVASACDGVTGIVHAAGHVTIGWSNLETARRTNTEGSRNLAIAAREAGIKLVHVSTVDTLGLGTPERPSNEESPFTQESTPCTYVVTKREAERAVLDEVQQGLQAVIVHPGFMLGPWDWKPSSGRMLLEVARRFTPISPRGGCSTCDVRDVAVGVISALDRGKSGEHYILAGHNVRYHDLWNLFAKTTGGKPPWFRAPGPVFPLIAGAFGDLCGKLTGREPDVNSAATQMAGQYHYYTSEKAIHELGYQMRPLQESIDDAWAWFREYDYAV